MKKRINYGNEVNNAGQRNEESSIKCMSYLSLSCTTEFSITMPALPRLVGSREPVPDPGNIIVTPIPLDPPIHSRPVLPSTRHFRFAANYTFPHAEAEAPTSKHAYWPLVIFFLLLVCVFLVLLSDWFWRKFTNKIWSWASRYDGPLEEDFEEEELVGQSARRKTTETVISEETNEWLEDLAC
jgi:hypothetical protein